MASMFHLFTHAMFKALLFLGAGSIIHAVHSNEMSAMGGLRKYMPITHITFLIRLPCHRRHSPVLRILLQGRDTDSLLPVQPRHGLDYDGDCRHDRILYVQTVLRHFLGQFGAGAEVASDERPPAISTRLTSRPLP